MFGMPRFHLYEEVSGWKASIDQLRNGIPLTEVVKNRGTGIIQIRFHYVEGRTN